VHPSIISGTWGDREEKKKKRRLISLLKEGEEETVTIGPNSLRGRKKDSNMLEKMILKGCLRKSSIPEKEERRPTKKRVSS